MKVTATVRINYNYGCSNVLPIEKWEDIPKEEHVLFQIVTVSYKPWKLKSVKDYTTLKEYYGFKVVVVDGKPEIRGISSYEWKDHKARTHANRSTTRYLEISV
jgi:predicted SPOUT superfamily RNA methylase MTH1